MSEQTAQEPTMEEILASIRRIISEDDAPAAQAAPEAEHAVEAAPAPAHEPTHETAPHPVEMSPALMDETPSIEDDDVLELTDRWEEPAPAPRPTPVQSIGDIDIEPAPRPFEAPREEPRYEPRAADPGEGLVSERTAAAAGSSFAGLAHSILMPREGRQLEDLVKELMKPMLRDWLEQHLPAIVETQVRAEVERIARTAR